MMTVLPLSHQTRGIAETALSYRLCPETLLLYESLGLLRPVRRGQDRFYRPSDEIRIQLIVKGERLGFTLAEIGAVIDFPIR
jgi:DNA-binding transcriptional MerR regulator